MRGFKGSKREYFWAKSFLRVFGGGALLLIPVFDARSAAGWIETTDGARYEGEIQPLAGAFQVQSTNAAPVAVELAKLGRLQLAGPPAATNVASETEAADPGAVRTNGLLAQYFNGRELGGPAVTRVDPKVDFNWGDQSPAPGIAPDNFSVRWRGQVRARASEPHTFFTQTDDGARLWVNGILVINAWRANSSTTASYPMMLTAGQTYEIRLEMFDAGEQAAAKLLWSSPSTPMGVIPEDHLLPARPMAPQIAAATPRAGPTGVLLRDGSRLATTVVAGDATALTLAEPWARLPLSVINVSAVIFRPLSSELELRLRSGRPGVLLPNGDFMDGDLKAIEPGRTNVMAGDLKAIEPGRIKVASILFGLKTFQTTHEIVALVLRPVKPEPWQFRVTTTDGSVLLARSLTVSTNALSVELPILEPFTLELSRLREIERAPVQSVERSAPPARLASIP